MDPSDAQRRIENLRKYRVFPERAKGMEKMMGAQRASLKREQRRSGGAGDVWDVVCPSQLLSRTSVGSYKRGVLTIHVTDHATMHQLDTFLRSGGQDLVIRTSQTPISKVVVKLKR